MYVFINLKIFVLDLLSLDNDNLVYRNLRTLNIIFDYKKGSRVFRPSLFTFLKQTKN